MLNKVEPDHEFNLLVTIAGLVHVKMNTARSFVFLIGNVFTSIFGYELGFKTIKT